MAHALSDPRVLAKEEADRINSNRQQWLVTPVDRVMADAPYFERENLLAGLTDFHRERMTRIPSIEKYPESKPWVDFALQNEAELKRLANLSDREIAIFRSLTTYLSFRGYKQAKLLSVDERCRCAYLPETDRGPMHIKNVDDPITHWKPSDKQPNPIPFSGDFVTDGVGSGLHIDDEPEDIFPLPVLTMLRQYANDVPSSVDFLTRYKSFWGGGNLLIHDSKKRSVAIEKCSFNFIEVFYPDSTGRSYISGMSCRDPQSPQGKYQRAKRDQAIELFGIGQDCSDNAFWSMCFTFEQKLRQALNDLPKVPTFADVVNLFTSAYPKGLRKDGIRLHPKQGLIGYTLCIHATLRDERKYFRWQRSQDGSLFPAQPEVFSF
ncbi:MAG: hypothetical protein IT444_09630 [Phycisphaeraceae bacterium]|nr:hypothetical protein [Phycisphaeraceae bacterium]